MINYEKISNIWSSIISNSRITRLCRRWVSNKEVSKANNKTTSSYSNNGNTQNNVDKEIANSNSYSNKYNNSYNNSSSSSYSNEGSDEDICFELSEEDLANLKNGLGLTVNGQNVDITGFDEKFREEVKAAGFE